MNTTPTPPMRTLSCPHCGCVLDLALAATHPGAKPEPGDIHLCWACRGIAVQTDTGQLRLPTPQEDALYAQEPAIQQVRQAMAESFTPNEAVNLYQKGARA